MKTLIPLLFLLLAAGLLAAEDPAELVELRQAWEKQRAEAQDKVDKLYFTELEELKKNYMKAQNLDAAVAVDREIKGEVSSGKAPAELQKMRKAYQNSSASERKRMDKRYWEDLKKLQKQYMDAADLPGATAADAEIKKVLAAYKKTQSRQKKTARIMTRNGADALGFRVASVAE